MAPAYEHYLSQEDIAQLQKMSIPVKPTYPDDLINNRINAEFAGVNTHAQHYNRVPQMTGFLPGPSVEQISPKK